MTDTSAAIRDCKREIANAVNAAIDTLRNATGISPSAVDIDLIETTTHGSPHREWFVAAVTLGFKL